MGVSQKDMNHNSLGEIRDIDQAENSIGFQRNFWSKFHELREDCTALENREERDRGPVVKLDINQTDPSLSSFDHVLLSLSHPLLGYLSRSSFFFPPQWPTCTPRTCNYQPLQKNFRLPPLLPPPSVITRRSTRKGTHEMKTRPSTARASPLCKSSKSLCLETSRMKNYISMAELIIIFLFNSRVERSLKILQEIVCILIGFSVLKVDAFRAEFSIIGIGSERKK